MACSVVMVSKQYRTAPSDTKELGWLVKNMGMAIRYLKMEPFTKAIGSKTILKAKARIHGLMERRM